MLKNFLLFVLFYLVLNPAKSQISSSLSYSLTYLTSQYDVFHSISHTLTKNRLVLNQEISLGHKYLVVGEFNWRICNQVGVIIPCSPRLNVELGGAIGFISQWRNLNFYQLQEDIYFTMRVKSLYSFFLRNSFGLVQQFKGNNQLLTLPNLTIQAGISYDI